MGRLLQVEVTIHQGALKWGHCAPGGLLFQQPLKCTGECFEMPLGAYKGCKGPLFKTPLSGIIVPQGGF